MLALLGLLGVGLTAASFVDIPATIEDADGVSGDADSGSPDNMGLQAISFDILWDDPAPVIIENAAEPVADFDPNADTVEIEYVDALPVLTTQASDTGLTLFADGDPVVTFAGLTNLDLSTVSLIAI